MRVWSIHPKQLDAAGLVALWREGLLAQKVLAGATRGYTRHPQLERFRNTADPLGAIGSYLRGVSDEATRRGYRFDASKIVAQPSEIDPIEVTDGQLLYEWEHLLRKLEVRNRRFLATLAAAFPECHPLFRLVPGPVAPWERP